MSTSGIKGFLYTKTSITIQFTNNDIYRYDLSAALTKDKLEQMIALAKQGSGLNSFLNNNPQIRKSGYIDTITNRNASFNTY